MSDDEVSEAAYVLMESAIDLIDYVVPSKVSVYVGTYVQIFTAETEVAKKDIEISVKNGLLTAQTREKHVKVPRKPGAKIPFPGLKRSLWLEYAVESSKTPLGRPDFEVIEENGKVRNRTYIPRGTYHASDRTARTFLVTTSRYADLVYDDAAEMWACGFTWGREINRLSEEMRRDLFERNLHDQKEMPQLAIDGRSWLKQLARYGTYDSNGNYYNKWAAGKPGPKRKHTDKYLELTKQNRHEIKLQKGLLYIYVKAKDGEGVLYSIDVASDGRAVKLTPHRMMAGLWMMPTLEENRNREFDVYFIATPEGAKDESRAPPRKGRYQLKDGDQASHIVIDPRKLVEAALGAEVTGNLRLSDGDEWAWFTQMCAALFPEPYYQIDLREAATKNHWVRELGDGGLRKEMRAFLEKAWKQQGSDDGKPITRAARNRVRRLTDAENVLVIPQGFPSSKNTRFIGTDGHYAFDRDIENGFVYVMPNHEYVGALVMGKFHGDIYDDVKWLIPLMEYTATLAAFAVGGFQLSARKAVIKHVGKEVIKDAIRSVRPALVALLVDVMLELVTKPVLRIYRSLDITDEDAALADDSIEAIERWQEFLRGFFEGYIVLNLEGRVSKLEDVLMPSEAKAVLIASRLYELVQKFRDYLERIEGILTDGVVAKILFNLDKASTHMVRGLASALAMLYYLDIDKVKPFLEVFSSDGKAPNPDQWAKESQEFFKAVSQQIDGLGADLADVRKVLDIGGTRRVAIGAAIGLGYTAFLTKTLGQWKHMPKAYAGLAVLAIGVIAIKGGGDEMINVGIELSKEVGRMFPGKDKKAANLNGQLIGKLVGTFLVDRALFGKDSQLGARLKERPVLKIAVEGSLGGAMVGSIFKVLFSRYVHLSQRLGDKVKLMHDDLTRFVQDEKTKKGKLDTAKTPHLKAFHSKSDEVLGFREFVEILVHLHGLLMNDRDAFEASIKEGGELREDFEALNRLTQAAAHVDLEKLADRELRAALIQMNIHAATAIHEMLKGFDYLFAEVGGDQSIMSILQELGIDTGDLAKAQEAVHKAVEPKMEGFKQAAEKHKQKQQEIDSVGKKEIQPEPLRP